MLIESGKKVTRVPYENEFRSFMSRMTAEEIPAIKATLNEKIEGTEVQTAGWMPGSDCTDTIYQPIYEKAARYDYSAAARRFGLIVWEVFMERPEGWSPGRFEKNGEPIGSRTYFRIR